jgi:hypothetical protein
MKGRAADDEPVFVLRAKDILAPRTVRYWANQAERFKVSKEKVEEARYLANQMESWAAIEGDKLPD